MIGLIILVLLVLLLVGAAPAWPHSYGWGYRPMGYVATVLLVFVIVMVLFGYRWGM